MRLAKPRLCELLDMSSLRYFNAKQLSYIIETGSGSVRISVPDPYHPNDREADRLGHIELRKILAAAAADFLAKHW